MSEPTNVGPVINDAADAQECDFSHDGLELYFSAMRPGGYGPKDIKDIWVAERETLNSPWQEPVNLGPNVNSSAHELEPSISGDGLELYFASWDDYILRVCTRPSKNDPWSGPVTVGPPIGYDAYGPDISADGLSLYFASMRGGGYGGDDIWVTTRATARDPWGEPVNLGPNVNSGAQDWAPSISTDGLTLVFNRGLWSMWATTRKSIDDDWGPAVKLGFKPPNPGVGTSGFHGAALSPDGSILYFEAYRDWGGYGKGDFWQVRFIPVVDFNGDQIVDVADMSIMVDNWHTNNRLCDIAPLPIGDGYVDVKDLLVLAEHLEPGDPTLIAHWKLDEVSGMIAADSAGNSDGTLVGNPTWQPAGGKIGGALLLDGSNDYIATGFACNPSDGPFSVFAWIKGGAPGHVIVSQTGGVDWLSAGSIEGKLMTRLSRPAGGRFAPVPLTSPSVVTDGNWHRVAFVWDGANRILCVDGVEVAKDAQASLAASPGGLQIGAGSTLAPGTFWSGLIDDVRIYDRAVKP